MQPCKPAILQRRLLRWYDENRRELPWRTAIDPYPVWISEVMLQQTQVQTVIPYYLRFLQHFPSIAALAQADTDTLLRLWAGLGYYSRARNLQKAARIVVEQFGGRFPQNHSDVLALPGIGRYTAAAIVSIAYGQRYAVLDGNVSRVLARLRAIPGNLKSAAVQRQLWDEAQQLVPASRAGDFNQAVMELGATVCTPRQPQCRLCPWTQQCLARIQGLQELLPEKPRRVKARRSLQAAIAIHHRGRFLIVRRSDQRLLHGFWEFPCTELHQKRGAAKALTRMIAESYGLDVEPVAQLPTIKHSITTRRIELRVFRANLARGARPWKNRPGHRWVRLQDMEDYAFASASQRIVQELNRMADVK